MAEVIDMADFLATKAQLEEENVIIVDENDSELELEVDDIILEVVAAASQLMDAHDDFVDDLIDSGEEYGRVLTEEQKKVVRRALEYYFVKHGTSDLEYDVVVQHICQMIDCTLVYWSSMQESEDE